MINLLPPKRLLDIRTARSNTNLRRYIELVLVSMAVLAFAVTASYYFLNTQQQNTKAAVELNQQKVTKLAPVQKQAEELSSTVNTISGLLSRDVVFSDTLKQIAGLMPGGSALSGLQFSIEDVEAPLVVSAQVDSEEKAAVLRNNLAASPLFSKAEIISIVAVEEKEIQATPVSPDTPVVSKPPSPYRFTTTINAYFKNATGSKKQ